MQTNERALRNILANAVSLVVRFGSGFAVSVIVARKLGPHLMGRYTFVLWYAGILVAISSLGLPDTATRYIAEYHGRGQRARAALVARKLLSLQVATAIVVTLAGALFLAFFAAKESPVVVLATVALVLPQIIQTFQSAVLAAVQRFDLILGVAFWNSAAQVCFVATASYLSMGVPALILANLGATLVAIGVGWAYCGPTLRIPDNEIDLAGEERRLPGMWNASLAFYSLWLLDLIVWERSELVFLRHYSGMAQVAFYGIAFGVAGKFTVLADTIAHLALPMAARAYGEGGMQAISQVNSTAIRYVQMLIVPLCWIGALVARPLVLAVYGAGYEPVVGVLRVFLVSVSFTALANVTSSTVFVLERYRVLISIGSAAAVLNILLNLLLVPRLGSVGAAIANCLVQAMTVAAATSYVARAVPGSIPWAAIARIYGATTISVLPLAYAVATRAGIAALAILASVALLIYCAAQLRFGGIGKNELKSFKNVVCQPFAKSASELVL